MTTTKTAAMVLGAGLGTRMKSDLPKVMHPVGGRPMVLSVLETLRAFSPVETVVVAAPEACEMAEVVAPATSVFQKERLGTAHAVMQARTQLSGFEGDVFILYGDTPLIRPQTLSAMQAARRAGDHGLVVLGFRPVQPAPYGRLIQENGELVRIVEARDASEAELAVDLCNSGVMCVEGARLFEWLDRVDNDNAKEEYYLTDLVAIARADGATCGVVEGEEEELVGVNSRADLAAAESVFQARKRRELMAAGVTLTAPETVFFSYDTDLGRDVVVEPHVVFAPGVTVAGGARIRAFSHLEGVSVGKGAEIGPYARLRPGSAVGEAARVGNFVELKKTTLGAGTKANHLTYLGDCDVGAGANIGAGTITCNYDGYEKHATRIGAGAFIGSDTALVAPVDVGAGTITGAGSVITHDVPAEALAVARGRQKNLDGWARRFHEKKIQKEE